MGIEEGTCWEEHWVLYVSNESQDSTPKTKSTLYTLYVCQLDNKLYLKKKEKKNKVLLNDFFSFDILFQMFSLS